MGNLILANTILGIHAAFICFVVLGGFLVYYRKWVVWLHLPAVAWGAWVEITGRICPLTPLENHFRLLAGQAGYNTGFIHHYLMRFIYPEGLTREGQILLGVGALVLNLSIYGWIVRHSLKSKKQASS